MGAGKGYLKDIGKSRLSDASAISGYTLVNSGAEMELFGLKSASMPMGKAIGDEPSIGKETSTKYYEEPEINRNSVTARTYELSGSLNFNTTTHRTLFANLCKALRSPAVFAFKCDLTLYDDNPVTTAYNGPLDGTNETPETEHFTENSFVYVVVSNFTPSQPDDGNVTNYRMTLKYTQL